MFRDWLQAVRIFATRLRIERPYIPTFPRFKTTQFFLWVVALVGLAYGRFITREPEAQSLSLLLSGVSWIAAVFILLLADPWPRLKRLLFQIISILLLLALFISASITYSLLFFATNAVSSLKIAWVGGTLLLGYLTLYSLYVSLVRIRITQEGSYPGLRTAPLLFLLLAVNYVWWSWQSILSFFL